MSFDEWMTSRNPKYRPTDDSMAVRDLRDCWNAAMAAERMACATICHHKFMELEHGTDRSDPQDDREASIQSRLAKELRNAIRDR